MRDMDRRALVTAEQQARYRKAELRDRFTPLPYPTVCARRPTRTRAEVPSVGDDLDATHGQNEKPVGPVARIAIEPGDVYEHVDIIIILRAEFIAVGNNGVRRGVVWVGVDVGRHEARLLHPASAVVTTRVAGRSPAPSARSRLLTHSLPRARMPGAPELLTRGVCVLGGEVAPLSGPYTRPGAVDGGATSYVAPRHLLERSSTGCGRRT
jgi:hypothetical protein